MKMAVVFFKVVVKGGVVIVFERFLMMRSLVCVFAERLFSAVLVLV